MLIAPWSIGRPKHSRKRIGSGGAHNARTDKPSLHHLVHVVRLLLQPRVFLLDSCQLLLDIHQLNKLLQLLRVRIVLRPRLLRRPLDTL